MSGIQDLLPAIKQAKEMLSPVVDRISFDFEFIGQHEGKQRIDATIFAHFFGAAVMVTANNVTEPNDLYVLTYAAAEEINAKIGKMNAETKARVAEIGAKINALYGDSK